MKAFNAIFKQTIRAAVRSKVFIVLFVLILVAVFGLPLTIKGDNTAAGLVQVSLTYALNVVIALISASTLWLGCAQLATEIEGYNIHLVVCKPCPRWKILAGKFCGVFLMHALLLGIAMMIIYGLTLFRLHSARQSGLFTQEDMERLHQETLVGRRQYYPVPANVGARMREEYDKRVRDGRINPNDDRKTVMEGLRRELVQQVMRNITVAPGGEHSWVFENVRFPKKDSRLYLRFRMYSGDISDTDQRQLPVDWGFEVYRDKDGNEVAHTGTVYPQVWYSSLAAQPFAMPGGSWQELSTIDPAAQAIGQDNFPLLSSMIIDKAGNDRVVLHFRNYSNLNLPDPKSIPADNPEAQEAYRGLVGKSTAIFQVVDGPVLLCRVAGFFNNFMRTMLMAVFQLAFLAGLGCAVGAIFSTPVAVFVAISYIVIGMVVPAAIDAPLTNDDGSYIYTGVAQRAAHYMARGVGMLVVTVDDLDCTSRLANGRLVEWTQINGAFWKVLVLRTGIIMLLGIAVLHRRELGLVIRRVV